MRTVKIVASSRELTKVEKIAYTDTVDAISIDEALQEAYNGGAELVVAPKDYIIMDIHNDNPKQDGNTDYKTIQLIDTDGNRYITGSKSFMEAFLNIYGAMEGDPFKIKVTRRESKNYKGKYFITCNIVL